MFYPSTTFQEYIERVKVAKIFRYITTYTPHNLSSVSYMIQAVRGDRTWYLTGTLEWRDNTNYLGWPHSHFPSPESAIHALLKAQEWSGLPRIKYADYWTLFDKGSAAILEIATVEKN